MTSSATPEPYGDDRYDVADNLRSIDDPSYGSKGSSNENDDADLGESCEAPENDNEADQATRRSGQSSKAISPADDNFDEPLPRNPPEQPGVEPLPALDDYDGSTEADVELLSKLQKRLFGHCMRNLNAAEKVDPAGPQHERLNSYACKLASQVRQLAATKHSILKS